VDASLDEDEEDAVAAAVSPDAMPEAPRP
jgi:hypothetical protein